MVWGGSRARAGVRANGGVATEEIKLGFEDAGLAFVEQEL